MPSLIKGINIGPSTVRLTVDSITNLATLITINNLTSTLPLTFWIFDEGTKTVLHSWTAAAGSNASTDITGLVLTVPVAHAYRAVFG